MWTDGLCVLEGTDSRSVPMERWVEEERGIGTKVEVPGAPPSVSWGLTRTSPDRNPVKSDRNFNLVYSYHNNKNI